MPKPKKTKEGVPPQTKEAKRLAERQRVNREYAATRQRAAERRAATKKKPAKPTPQQKAVKRSEQRIKKYAPSGWQRLLEALGLQ